PVQAHRCAGPNTCACVSQAFGGGGTFGRLTSRGGRQAEIIGVSTASLGLYAGGLDDRAPFPVIGTNLGIEVLWRAADRRRAKLRQSLLDGLSVQGCDEVLREFLTEVARPSGPPEQTPPHLAVVPRHGLG